MLSIHFPLLICCYYFSLACLWCFPVVFLDIIFALPIDDAVLVARWLYNVCSKQASHLSMIVVFGSVQLRR
jgi:hypothetical protein